MFVHILTSSTVFRIFLISSTHNLNNLIPMNHVHNKKTIQLIHYQFLVLLIGSIIVKLCGKSGNIDGTAFFFNDNLPLSIRLIEPSDILVSKYLCTQVSSKCFSHTLSIPGRNFLSVLWIALVHISRRSASYNITSYLWRFKHCFTFNTEHINGLTFSITISKRRFVIQQIKNLILI
ncbi:hypothetical protein AGLY_003886 [Aphis glycines]|uniref:Uncharacterized protein n=1 Tax=Aphis glycines TaxID=307491 RepID=A0A6G0TZW0_APHGL|nr:hypothetical protein AGLY_003886 [Aphis glycines]